MKTLRVNIPGHTYDIIIGQNILKDAAAYFENGKKPAKILLITDKNVAPLYAETVEKALSEVSQVHTVVLPAGETTKSLDYLKKLYDEAFDFGMTRSDFVVALGGGVIGDLSGFFASTLLRGVGILQIPTTLLSQVDSSVGGKTAIDVSQGKNLVGTFYQPKQVLIDTDTLKTLSDKEFFGGLAEVIKYGAIWDADLFRMLERAKSRDAIMEKIEEIVYTCCDIKRQVVEEDEHDTGLRMILNFGHTAGHIVEKAYDYTGYVHGEAVAFGMTVAARLGEKMGVTVPGTAERLTAMMKSCGLPTHIPVDEKQLLSVALDKKASGSSISVILLEKIGKCKIVKLPVAEFCEQSRAVWSE